jgi:tetratricopeptide (TPR) repeat protein
LDEATGDAYMILAGAEGHRQHLGAARLARVLASKKSSSLVWLGPCPGAERGPGERFSVAASTLVQRGLPAVLTTPYLMSDKASVAFARVLFTALAGALPVELAVAQARSAVYQQAIRPGEWGIPVLYAHKPSWQLVDRAALAATASVRGDAALAQDDFAEAIDGYRLASEIDAHPVDLERKELAEEIRRILGDANHTLSTLTGSAESQAVAVMKAMEDLEKAQQSLPESRTIELVLSRARQEALALRDRLWSEGQQLMKSHAVGQTLDRRHRRAERCVRLFEKAVKLDSESLPALSEDLTRAVNRLGYLRQAQASIRAQRGRRRLLYGIVSVAVIAGLLWLSVAFGLVPAAMFKVKVPKVALLPPRPTAAYTLVPASATATVPLPTATFTVVATPVPEQVSATATLSPVWSSTPSPSPTHAARPSPSRTAMPSAFASPTLGLTPAHTQTPALIYPSETPTATPRRATPTPVPTPTRGIVYAAPTLLQPEDVIYLSQDSSGLLTMRWTWAGTLQPDEWFDIRVWREGTPHYGIAWTKQSEYTYDICLKGSGQVYWSIAIVHGQNGQWLSDLSPEAAPRRFWSSRSDEWCSSRGRPVQSLPPATGAP